MDFKEPLMNVYKDPYEILGLDPSATEKEIKKRYRLLSRKFHPDLNPHDPEAGEKFKRIRWAYERIATGETRRNVRQRATEDRAQADPFVDDSHPFHGFFEALEAYGIKMKRERKEEEV
jgi:curved DNA-binding protein CbpA